MTTSAGRRGNFFGKENITALDAPKASMKEVIADKVTKYDQENLLNGLKNGCAISIPDSYVGYSNIPNYVII